MVAVVVERSTRQDELQHHTSYLATHFARPQATSEPILKTHRKRGTAEAHIGRSTADARQGAPRQEGLENTTGRLRMAGTRRTGPPSVQGTGPARPERPHLVDDDNGVDQWITTPKRCAAKNSRHQDAPFKHGPGR